MLVLSRKTSQRIVIGEDIVLTILNIDGKRVRLGIEAPNNVPIQREEILKRVEALSVSPASLELTIHSQTG